MMTRRSQRTSARRATSSANVSSSWYVGYAEDEESVDAIMKKFDELENLQADLAKPVALSSSSTCMFADPQSTMHDSPQPIEEEDTTTTAALTQEQLEELFKRTSAFTVRSAQEDPSMLDDTELFQLLEDNHADGDWDTFVEEADDYDVADEDFWEDETPHKRSISALHSRRRYASVVSRSKLLQYRQPSTTSIAPRPVTAPTDPRVYTVVRIPPDPIPRSWVKRIRPFRDPNQPCTGSRYFESPKVFDFDYSILGNDFQAVLIDPPLLLPREPPSPGKVSVEQLSKLPIPTLIPKGFLFIWTPKELTPAILSMADKSWSGFRYVENFVWVRLRPNNTIARQPSRFFARSKTTCLIFRKEGQLDLRHQRSADCEFDFIKPMQPGESRDDKPEFIYELIETLLPQSTYDPAERPNGDRLLELWGRSGRQRSGWTHVVEKVAIDANVKSE
ncbi:hypothetical protein BJ742DRAFT_846698 [Cladochytrium replicatum]|nr:hypothetical protein BJ742DRAFT_846698 [Cladochytrium replicatum]